MMLCGLFAVDAKNPRLGKKALVLPQPVREIDWMDLMTVDVDREMAQLSITP
jgi:hypothetical protein